MFTPSLTDGHNYYSYCFISICGNSMALILWTTVIIFALFSRLRRSHRKYKFICGEKERERERKREKERETVMTKAKSKYEEKKTPYNKNKGVIIVKNRQKFFTWIQFHLTLQKINVFSRPQFRPIAWANIHSVCVCMCCIVMNSECLAPFINLQLMSSSHIP